ncbi:MAG: sugar phosphate isomerase/epimerase [bacterium]|nr:sugar phosphate isomerase/epimerase [bacterium]
MSGQYVRSRRDLLLLCLEAAGIPAAFGERFQHPLGAQLYTVRTQIENQPEATLRAIAKIGYEEVEVQDGLYPKVAPLLSELGLKIRGYRLAPAIITGNWDLWRGFMKKMGGQMGLDRKEQSVEEAIAPAAKEKTRYVVASYVLPPERDTVDKLKQTAERFNRCGEVCKKAGLTLCYHNHAFEFGPLEGTTAFDALTSEFDPALVEWQIDVFWAAVGGKDPAALINKHGQRIASLHLKDMAKATPRGFAEMGIPPESFQPVGRGVLDFPAILGAANKAGIEHFFVEQDQTDGNPVDALRESYQNLRKMQL